MEEEFPNLPEQPWDWEEISLNILHNSKPYQDERSPIWGRKKHRLRWLGKPRAIPQVILKLQDPRYRESALHLLSSFLFEKRKEDPENYYRTGFLLYDSCCTMAILLQELIAVYGMMVNGCLTERASMRLINVIILFQCVAANKETRMKLVKSGIANFLMPFVLFESTLEVYGNVRAVALSVFGILCQEREADVIKWALQSKLVEVCQNSVETGNELTKLIGMHILESILQDELGTSYIFSRAQDQLLNKLMQTWENLATLIVADGCYSPRLLFHIIRCNILLCSHLRRHNIVEQILPDFFTDGYLHDTVKGFPVIHSLLLLLLLIAGKSESWVVSLQTPLLKQDLRFSSIDEV